MNISDSYKDILALSWNYIFELWEREIEKKNYTEDVKQELKDFLAKWREQLNYILENPGIMWRQGKFKYLRLGPLIEEQVKLEQAQKNVEHCKNLLANYTGAAKEAFLWDWIDFQAGSPNRLFTARKSYTIDDIKNIVTEELRMVLGVFIPTAESSTQDCDIHYERTNQESAATGIYLEMEKVTRPLCRFFWSAPRSDKELISRALKAGLPPQQILDELLRRNYGRQQTQQEQILAELRGEKKAEPVEPTSQTQSTGTTTPQIDPIDQALEKFNRMLNDNESV